MPPATPKTRIGLLIATSRRCRFRPGPLSPRQAEVLGLIVGGKRNREIAELPRMQRTHRGKTHRDIKLKLGGGYPQCDWQLVARAAAEACARERPE